MDVNRINRLLGEATKSSETNPFGTLADSYSRGASIRQPSCQALPWMIERLKAIV
jgi:hypothetical protein